MGRGCVQDLHNLFCFIAAACCSCNKFYCKFYCMFYFTCDRTAVFAMLILGLWT